jgi:hypothetical protein
MIFTAQQIRAIRQGRMIAVLAPQAERVRAGSVRLLRRRGVPAGMELAPAAAGRPRDVLAHIEARLDVVETVTVVCDTTPDGEQIAVVLTVLAVEDVELDAVTLHNARACGWRTTGELRAAWASQHPRMRSARLVWFALGDLRDAPLLIGRGWPDYTHDPSRAMFAEPEPVSPGEYRRQATDAQQRYLRLQADRERQLAQSSVSERLAAIQRGTVATPDTGTWH